MKRVLIVDDHRSATESCCRSFSDLGADVLAASNARTGYRCYVTQQSGIAIIGLKLGSDAVAGLSLIRRMRVHGPAGVIVALSMNDDPATRQGDAGATAFVSKDAQIGELLQAYEKSVQRNQGGGK
jgi:two-component system, NarL family, invasion response regulator UvrY